MMFISLREAAIAAGLFTSVAALLNATESSTQFILGNDRLVVTVDKTNGEMSKVTLDGHDLTGNGKGPYLDCHCTPDGFWAPGPGNISLITGTDSTGTDYGGIVVSDTYEPTNQTLEQYWFLRENETGLHMFTRATYFNDSAPFLVTLGELRTLFRPNTSQYTHLYSSEDNIAPYPSVDTQNAGFEAQDATKYLNATPSDPYVTGFSDFFTKYSFSEQWRNHKVHGLYADGSASNGTSYGAWLVHNTVETYYGGPLHSDFMVDGIVYNYLVSGHQGGNRPNLTDGFDRTWGPQFYYFNSGGDIEELAADAAQYADPTWNAEFYDDIAEHVPNYVTSEKRLSFSAVINLPANATNPVAVISENRRDFQNNTLNDASKQYWAEIDVKSGRFTIPRVVSGVYRLTVYAEGIFGWFIQDNVDVTESAGELEYTWTAESAGTEIWRIGIPDKTGAEYKHGRKPYANKTLHPEEFRQYWAVWDFPTDFPDGVNFKVGESDYAEDFNYIHWSVISAKGNVFRNEDYHENVNNWTIRFDLDDTQVANTTTATLTVALASAKTGSGTEDWVNLPYTLNVNGEDVETFIIPWFRSTSCGVRGAVSCSNFDHKFVFDSEKLVIGENSFILSLPADAASNETAVLPETTYLQYDALRLELD